jgi:hypothetical protein
VHTAAGAGRGEQPGTAQHLHDGGSLSDPFRRE